jgi:selenocysteine lyase/cysteine desulfurase
METGTQNHEGIAGAGAAVEFLASLSRGANRREGLVRTMSALHARGDELFARLWDGLSAIKGLKCYGPPPARPRTPTISFTVDGMVSKEIATSLVNEGIFASNGNFYATTVIERLGQTGRGLMRAGCACYTTMEEIDRLIAAVRRAAKAG